MAKQKIVACSDVIARLCAELKYSRSHVANIVRRNSVALRARFEGQWLMPERSVATLRALVKRTSGPRYKLGETGAHRGS